MASETTQPTTNPNKVREITPLLAGLSLDIITLADVPPVPEPEETGATFWENARLKALAYAKATGEIAVAEDSGLEIDALGGEPGVQSARFLGASTAYPARFEKSSGGSDRSRAMRACHCAWSRARSSCSSRPKRRSRAALPMRRRAHGFGYDPIFLYPPFGCTTAQLIDADKATVSHRARAFRDLRRWLTTKAAGEMFQAG